MSIRKHIKNHALNKFFYQECIENYIVHLCPAIASDNVGDAIIADAVSRELEELFPSAQIGVLPCKTPIHEPVLFRYNCAKFRFLGGTNILRGQKPRRTWVVNYSDIWKYRPAILMGAGWGKYQKKISFSSRFFYKNLLDRHLLHSVRDNYTREQLLRCGISNVLYTACPTTWKLTEDFCRQIPLEQKSSVVITLTDYAKNPQRDRFLLETCAQHYKTLFFFPQSHADLPYFYDIVPESVAGKVQVIAPTLAAYDRLLDQEQPDFVGTRLHGGIRAMQHRCRALVIGIDNRAKEMGKDISLPFIPQETMASDLLKILKNGWTVQLKIPQSNIDQWKNQFR